MGRSYMKDERGDQHLPQSVRLFEDYSCDIVMAFGMSGKKVGEMALVLKPALVATLT